MFDRPEIGERALLVHIFPGGDVDEDQVQEFRELVVSAGGDPVAEVLGSRRIPDPRLYVGRGKLEEIRESVESHEADLVLFDHALSPTQERNLERELKCRVLDREGLILDIFAQRARSHEGKLQVELAQLRHLSTRLVRGWTHLERQKGGIGLRGPGETQLETDRRLLGQRILQIQRRLEKVDSQRELGRKARRRADLPTTSLVGYTNAGKSTLFNRLTEAGVYARDQLFATLDPTLRRVGLPDGSATVLADTVGFISKLPHDFVAAFRSTLRETADAELLVHVIDASGPQLQLCVSEVNEVLGQIGANKVPQIEVYNKIDRVEGLRPRIERDEQGTVTRVWLSAKTGEGVDLLLAALAEHHARDQVSRVLRLKPSDGRLRSELFSAGQVYRDVPLDSGGWEMSVQLERRDFERLVKRHPGLGDSLVA
jgi:GTP-binding protein HflX